MSGILLVVLAPVMFMVGLLVRWHHGIPILFVQERCGIRGRVFRMYKFRTMREEVARDGEPVADEFRITQLGKWLRATSLDKLPSLWNVFVGKMSLVGPRPLLPEYLHRYTPEQARRHEVSPGITGWAQVNGRNAISWEEKFELEVWYVDHQSFWLDLKILWLTVVKVIRRADISASDHATMPEFRGSSEETRRAA